MKTFPLEYLVGQLTENGHREVCLSPRVLKMILTLVANQERIMQQYNGHIELHFEANDIQAKIWEPLKKTVNKPTTSP